MQIPDLVVYNSKVHEHWKVLRIADRWTSAHRLPMGGGKKLASACWSSRTTFSSSSSSAGSSRTKARKSWDRSPFRLEDIRHRL